MRTSSRAGVIAALALLLLLVALGYAALPYARALSLIVRAADLGGVVESVASGSARAVTVLSPHPVPTRQGSVTAQYYVPNGGSRRTVLLVPGIHSLGIEEPRLTALARDLAGSGVRVMTMALPDLQQYQITAMSSDVIEDAVLWMARQSDLAHDGRVGVIGISFAGGLSIVAAGRHTLRDRVAFVVSFGGHGNLTRVMRYLATGETPQVPGLRTQPPHDYGVAVILYAGADRLVPAAQVRPLRDGVGTFLLASQLTLVDTRQADAMFEKARAMADNLPEPAATYLALVNARNVKELGKILLPHIALESDPAASPELAPSTPAAPVFLLHGSDDTVIPAAESVVLASYLRERGVDVRVLLSGLITHAEVDRSAAMGEVAKLVGFWRDVLWR